MVQTSVEHHHGVSHLFLMTAEEVAALLRTTRSAIDAMAERGLLPGVTRIGRRLAERRFVAQKGTGGARGWCGVALRSAP